METVLDRAAKAVGGVVALAKLVGVSSQAVSQWEKIPPKHCLTIERATGISCHEQRPDIFAAPINSRPCDTEPQEAAQ